ncbi:hypothetical protein R6Q59_004714 [Mikania micrantha]
MGGYGTGAFSSNPKQMHQIDAGKPYRAIGFLNFDPNRSTTPTTFDRHCWTPPLKPHHRIRRPQAPDIPAEAAPPHPTTATSGSVTCYRPYGLPYSLRWGILMTELERLVLEPRVTP